MALGDGPQWTKGQPETSMFSLYSSAQVGIFGAIIKKTNVDKILQLNCNATDFYQTHSFPTYLYYNPYDSSKSISYTNEEKFKVDLYDVIEHEYIGKQIVNQSTFTIDATTAKVIVVLPSGSKIRKLGNQYRVGDKVVAYQITQSISKDNSQ